MNAYTIGRDCDLVVLVLGTRIDLRDVTSFEARQEVSRCPHWPFNGDPFEVVVPAGWRGSFEVTRGNAGVDTLFARLERASRISGLAFGFPEQGVSSTGPTDARIYQYVPNPDGSRSTFEFVGASLTLADAGRYTASDIVRQRVEFFASYREDLS